MDAGLYNKYKKGFEDIIFPGEGNSWQGLVKYDQFSRWAINDLAFDDCVNFLPMGASLRQVPANGPPIATLPSTVTWIKSYILNNGTYIFALCGNGSLYQVSAGGAVSLVGTGFSQFVDAVPWQGSVIVISDQIAAKVFSWNGIALSTIFTGQPVSVMQIFAGRLWMSFGNTITFTAGGTYNNLGGDGGSFVIGDSDTPPSIIALWAFLGQLYVFGPDWIQTIGNLFNSGSPSVLQFQRYTLEDQIGPANRFSIIPYGAYLYFANSYGIWMLQGLQPIQISQPIDGFFQSLNPSSTFSSAFTQIYGVPCLCWHVNWSGDNNDTILIYTGGQMWCRSIGSAAIKFITDQVVVPTGTQVGFGTDGTSIFSLFSQPQLPVASSIKSKLWNGAHPVMVKQGEYLGIATVTTGSAVTQCDVVDQNTNVQVSNTRTIQTLAQWANNSGVIVQWQNNASQVVSWAGTQVNYSIQQFAIPFLFRAFGINYSITSAGAVFINVVYQVKPTPAVWGA